MQLHEFRGWRPLNGRPDCVWLVGHRSGCRHRLSLRPLRQLGLWYEQRLCSWGMRYEALHRCYVPLPYPSYADRVSLQTILSIVRV